MSDAAPFAIPRSHGNCAVDLGNIAGSVRAHTEIPQFLKKGSQTIHRFEPGHLCQALRPRNREIVDHNLQGQRGISYDSASVQIRTRARVRR